MLIREGKVNLRGSKRGRKLILHGSHLLTIVRKKITIVISALGLVQTANTLVFNHFPIQLVFVSDFGHSKL